MTDQTPAQRPALTGADLARDTLRAYARTAKTQPATKAPSRKRGITRGSGRDPVRAGSVIAAITDIPEWSGGVAGGIITDRWAELCPQYAGGLVTPVAYDPERGRLDLRPSSAAYATQLRLLGGALAKQINDKLGEQRVRAIRVLAPSTTTATAAGDRPTKAAPAGPVRTREDAPAGFQDAHAAIQQVRIEREALTGDERRWSREPQSAFDQLVESGAAYRPATMTSRRSCEESRQAALRAKRASRRQPAA
ncbi:DciA family protein [Streptomyces albidoflavus]